MTNLKYSSTLSVWLIAVLSAVLFTGCGGGTWDGTPNDNGVDTETPVVPLVADTNPDVDAINVAITSAVNTTFNVAMDEATINGTTFTLTGPDAAEVTGDVTYSAGNRTATFVPTDDLEFATVYTATITTGAESSEGVALAADHSWSFTTLDAEEAVFIAVSESNPIDEGTGVCTNRTVKVTFDEPLDSVTIESPSTNFTLIETLNTFAVEGEVTLDELGTTATFTPTEALFADVEYTARVTTDVTDLNGNTLENDVVWSFTTSESFCQEAITLGATQTYGVLSNTGVTLGGGPDSTTGLRVDGDVGIFPAGACIGCDSTTVSGLIEIGTTVASDAMDALEAAYNEAINRSTNRCTLIDSGALTTNPSVACGGGADGVFAPGLYWSSTSIAIPAGGTITLDAANDADAVFIFQSESTIDTIGGNTHIILANGAQAKNVFWLAASSATIGGVNSDFAGTVLALIGITVNTGTDMAGRALARGAAVTVQDDALITVPTE